MQVGFYGGGVHGQIEVTPKFSRCERLLITLVQNQVLSISGHTATRPIAIE